MSVERITAQFLAPFILCVRLNGSFGEKKLQPGFRPTVVHVPCAFIGRKSLCRTFLA